MRNSFVAALLLFASLAPTVVAEPPRVPNDAITRALRAFVDNKQVAGVVGVIATKDRVLYCDGVGYSNFETKTPMTLDAMFWIASMTKSMTGAALMMLVDEDKLSLDDPVEKYLPEFKKLVVADDDEKTRARKPSHPVTVRELCSHTHGMADVKTRNVSLADDVTRFTAAPMDCDPGTRFKYSNVSLNVAGRLIEVLSGMSYYDFMRTRLFEPLGMNDATFWPSEAQVARLARTYMQKKDKSGIANVKLDIPLPAGSTVPPAL
ncbi:MAG TPA: serine hydrolase domain-containing protein, partial [Pirellulales bacterium]|nr:serine hydrolase domain-containing protein [Pirellulales bacterium]